MDLGDGYETENEGDGAVETLDTGRSRLNLSQES